MGIRRWLFPVPAGLCWAGLPAGCQGQPLHPSESLQSGTWQEGQRAVPLGLRARGRALPLRATGSSWWLSPAQLQPHGCPIPSRAKLHQPRRHTGHGKVGRPARGHSVMAPALSRSVCSRKISTFGCRDFQGCENTVLIIKHLLCICLPSCRDTAPALPLPSLSSSMRSGPGRHPLLPARPQPGGTASQGWVLGERGQLQAPL